MSADDTTETPTNKKRGGKVATGDTLEAATTEPVPRDLNLFSFLEELFDGQDNFPEIIDTRIMTGRNFSTMGPKIKRYPFTPSTPKPPREKLVSMVNEILHRTQADCDARRKRTVYGVMAMHFTTDSEPYCLFLLPRDPGKTYRNGIEGDAENDEEEDSIEKRYSVQILRHQEAMFERLGAATEGVVDRMDRMLERAMASNEAKDQRIEHLVEMLERSRSLEEERQQKRRWEELKIQGVNKGIDLAMSLAPPLASSLVGKQQQQGGGANGHVVLQETPETLTLRKFLQPEAQGGTLTQEQAHRAFGVYDGTQENNLVSPGALSRDQVALLYGVAMCELPASELDKLMPGAGALSILPEQVAALQNIFPMEQMMPLFLIFEARRPK